MFVLKKLILLSIAVFVVAWVVGTNFFDSEKTVYKVVPNSMKAKVSEPEVVEYNLEKEEKIKAPEFKVSTLDGEVMKLSEYEGQRVILNFWTTWCPPCKEEMPQLQKYFEEAAEKQNTVVLAMNMTDQEEGIAEVQQFVDKNELSFPILLDETDDVSINYGILTIPTTFILDEDGFVEEQILGPITEEMLIEKLGKVQ